MPLVSQAAKKTSMYDVAIIGAGPSGTAAAFHLLSDNKTVVLIDKNEFPRKKACAGGLTPKAKALYPFDISCAIKKTCRRVKVTDRAGGFYIKHQDPLCYITNRTQLDYHALNTVCNLGADFVHFPHSYRIQKLGDKIEINALDRKISARYLIGSDGSNSFVRRSFVNTSFNTNRFAIEADIEVPNPGLYDMEFDFSWHKKGYAWIFPQDKIVNIGFYSFGSRNWLSKDELKKYARRKLGTDTLFNIKGYPIATGGFRYPELPHNIMLSGDAAAMAEPLLGEGLYFALKTGRLAAEAINQTYKNQGSAHKIYKKSVCKIQKDLLLHHTASRFLYHVPDLSLKMLRNKRFHTPFANGYADGLPLIDILTQSRYLKLATRLFQFCK